MVAITAEFRADIAVLSYFPTVVGLALILAVFVVAFLPGARSIYHDLGEVKNSLELLSKASRLSSGNGEIQYHYPAVPRAWRDVENARQIRQALRINDVQFPSHYRADILLGEL